MAGWQQLLSRSSKLRSSRVRSLVRTNSPSGAFDHSTAWVKGLVTERAPFVTPAGAPGALGARCPRPSFDIMKYDPNVMEFRQTRVEPDDPFYFDARWLRLAPGQELTGTRRAAPTDEDAILARFRCDSTCGTCLWVGLTQLVVI